MRLLFIGPDWYGSNARSMADGFSQAGVETMVVDTTAVNRPSRYSGANVLRHLGPSARAVVSDGVLRTLENVARTFKPDVVFGFKTVNFNQVRLLEIAPSAVYVHYSADDVSNPYNTTPQYLEYESQWDLIVTTKRHNVPELVSRGARDVLFVPSAYDPSLHRRVAARTAARYAAGFVGNFRPDRAASIRRLSQEFGSDFFVAGPGWSRRSGLDPKTRVDSALYGDAFSRAVATITSNLVFLNSENRDQHTCRSYEVPAAGGLVVGQWSPEHESLLDHGSEAFWCRSEQEYIDAISEMSRDADRARAIAERGHRRITTGANTYADRAVQILNHLGTRARGSN